jgi:parallel beta-helix repeat protein
MVALSRKAKLIIQGTLLAIILVFLVVVAALANTGIYTNYYPKYSPPDPKDSIHIAPDGSITAPTTYNETVPIQRNGDKYTLTGDITLTVIVDRSNIVVDGCGFSVATKFQPGQGGPGFGLKVLGVSNVTVENIKSPVGLELEQSTNCTVQNSDGAPAVYLYKSNGNVISNCVGSLQLSYASNNKIENCSVHGSLFGLDLENSNSNYILYCTCTSPGRPVALGDSSNNVLFGNVFPDAWWWINMWGSCTNNYFVANNVTISQHYGSDSIVGTNYIYHNNFLQWNWNQSATDNSANVWSQNGRGNYYGGYAQVDANHDGVIDVPFTIDRNNVDNYPLVEPVNTAAEPIPSPVQ